LSITYVCNAALGCTFTRWDGEVTPAEWTDHVDRLVEDPAFPPGLRVLIDLRSASTELITRPVLEEQAARWRNLSTGMPELRAAFVPSENREKVEQFVELLRHANLRLGVFHQVSAACGWLDVDQVAAKAALQKMALGADFA
jgi:hypothetical protein